MAKYLRRERGNFLTDEKLQNFGGKQTQLTIVVEMSQQLWRSAI